MRSKGGTAPTIEAGRFHLGSLIRLSYVLWWVPEPLALSVRENIYHFPGAMPILHARPEPDTQQIAMRL